MKARRVWHWSGCAQPWREGAGGLAHAVGVAPGGRQGPRAGACAPCEREQQIRGGHGHCARAGCQEGRTAAWPQDVGQHRRHRRRGAISPQSQAWRRQGRGHSGARCLLLLFLLSPSSSFSKFRCCSSPPLPSPLYESCSWLETREGAYVFHVCSHSRDFGSLPSDKMQAWSGYTLTQSRVLVAGFIERT